MGEICDLLDRVTGCNVGTIEEKKIGKASYYRISISLDKPLNNVKLSIAGEYLTVAKIKGFGSTKMRFNHPNATLIDLREIGEMEGHFDEVYFTTDGFNVTDHPSECIIYVATTPNSTIRTGRPYIVDGGAFNIAYTTTNEVQRFTDYDLIANEFHIRNSHAINDVMIGVVPIDYLPGIATFRDYAFQIVELYTFKLTKINLRTLGTSTKTNGAFSDVRCIGTIQE